MNNNKLLFKNIKYKVECLNSTRRRGSVYIINILDNGFGGTDKVRLVTVEELDENGKFLGIRRIPYSENNRVSREVLSELGKLLKGLSR